MMKISRVKCPRCKKFLAFDVLTFMDETTLVANCCGSGLKELQDDWGLGKVC